MAHFETDEAGISILSTALEFTTSNALDTYPCRSWTAIPLAILRGSINSTKLSTSFALILRILRGYPLDGYTSNPVLIFTIVRSIYMVL